MDYSYYIYPFNKIIDNDNKIFYNFQYMLKLIGFKNLSIEEANKYLAMILSKQRMEKDFTVESEEVYELPGAYVEGGKFSDKWTEQIYLVSMKNKNFYDNYFCYVDRDDGYRSYAIASLLTIKDYPMIDNLKSYNLDVKIVPSAPKSDIKNNLVLKCKDKLIFECKTDFSDSYYPLGIIHDHLVDLKLI